MKHKIFISAAISSYKDNEYIEKRNEVLALIRDLKHSVVDTEVFYAGQQLNEDYNFQNPGIALQKDILEIENCDLFILIYTEALITSALVEIGYAMCRKIDIGIFVKDRGHLPFLLRQCDEVYDYMSVHQINKDLPARVIGYVKQQRYKREK